MTAKASATATLLFWMCAVVVANAAQTISAAKEKDCYRIDLVPKERSAHNFNLLEQELKVIRGGEVKFHPFDGSGNVVVSSSSSSDNDDTTATMTLPLLRATLFASKKKRVTIGCFMEMGSFVLLSMTTMTKQKLSFNKVKCIMINQSSFQ